MISDLRLFSKRHSTASRAPASAFDRRHPVCPKIWDAPSGIGFRRFWRAITATRSRRVASPFFADELKLAQQRGNGSGILNQQVAQAFGL